VTKNEGARAFLLGRIHPAIWFSCLGYLAPVAGSLAMKSGAGAGNLRVFGLAFLSAAFVLVAGAFVALWRMGVQKRANPAGPHYAGRLVAIINIAMGVGAFILFIVVPAGHGPISGNESSAIGTLRSLVTAQEQFRAEALVDLDGDTKGEYGTLGELAGTDPLRGSDRTMATAPFIARMLGMRHEKTAFARKGGYLFVLYLPSKEHGTVVHPPGSGGAPAVTADADGQEARWAVYAWPVDRGNTGRRAFFVSHEGNVYGCRNLLKKYSGATNAPHPRAVFIPAKGEQRSIEGALGIAAEFDGFKTKSSDGEVWLPAGN
jgi:hypothetical protein